jgi:hypothetical protein
MPARSNIPSGAATVVLHVDDHDRCVQKVDPTGDGLAATSITPPMLERERLPSGNIPQRSNGSGSAHDEREVMDERLAAYDRPDKSAGLWCAVT